MRARPSGCGIILRMATARRHGSYGIDAPYVLLWFAGFAVAVAVWGAVEHVGPNPLRWPGWLDFTVLWIVGPPGTYLYTTLRGKFVVWSRLLDEVGFAGDEDVLDLGCGRGLVLLMAAEHLPRGHAVGLDLWRGVDQSGNTEEATRRNAEIEGVSDRVELVTGDMRDLPFPDSRFDAVLSSLAIHNVPTADGRRKAVLEAARVVRPGGRLLLADIRHARAYAAWLAAAGWSDVAVRGLGWRFWYGGPWGRTTLVSATRPRA